MNTADGTWTLGVKLGLPCAVAATIGFAVLAVLAIRWGFRERDRPYGDALLGYVLGGVATLLALIVVVACAFGYWPYKAEYHQYRTTSGVVASIGDRINQASTGDTVVTLVGGSQQYDILDTRGALLRVGDRVSMQCIRVYEYGSTNAGYDCKWGHG